MTINHAILGILSYQPMTGYDLKKIIQDSAYMHWSGNNNQIYKALLELLADGFVTNEVIFQESSPSKKIYTITGEGIEELKRYVSSEPEPAEFRKSFLLQLAWADLLGDGELNALLAAYEKEIRLQLIMNREKMRRGNGFSARSKREAFLWRMVDENIQSAYQNELEWIQTVRKELVEHGIKGEMKAMNMEIGTVGDTRYIEIFSLEAPVRTEQDALDLAAVCWEKEINRLIVHQEALSADFFNLKTGVAGAVLQKFVNYSIKLAMVIPDQSQFGIRFRELVSEVNKGSQYRIFSNVMDAKTWLLKEG